MATTINLAIHPSITRNPDVTFLNLIADSKAIVERCSNTNIEETLITWEQLFGVSQLCQSRNIKMHIRYTKDGQRHDHTGYSLDEYLSFQICPPEEQPTEDKLITQAKALFARLGGIGNSDARIVGALITKIESIKKP